MAETPLQIRSTRIIRGPNIWADYPVIELLLDLGTLKDSPSDEIPGFNDRLKVWLPSLVEHRCSLGERGGFFQRLDRGTYMAHILEHVTLELQTLAGTAVGFGRARETDEEGVYRVAIDFEEESLALACIQSARSLLIAAVEDLAFDVDRELARLRDLAHEVCLGPSTAAIARAARARRIPVRRLGRENLLQLGWGERQRRVWTAETDATGAVAEQIAQDKQLTRMLLASVGVPVPEGRPVESAEDAWSVAQSLGTPVAIKPRYGNHGRGVTANLSTRDQVLAAYAAAREESRNVLCERWVRGADHRLLVVGGRVAAAALREPAQVIGDGRSSVRELVAETNRDPRRSPGHGTVLSAIELGPIELAVLADQGFTSDAIPPAGARVLLRTNANLSTGGTATDVTDRVHPEVAARAVEATRVVGLDIAGVDILAADISQPLESQGGAVVEVNAGPGLRMHLEPSQGHPRPVGESIVDLLFPPGEDGRIPLVAVGGGDGKDRIASLVAHLISATGVLVGLATAVGTSVGGRLIARGDSRGPDRVRALLLHPSVQGAVVETEAQSIRWEGLGFDRCLAGIVAPLGDWEGPGMAGIESMEHLIRVERCVAEAVAIHGTAVLAAEDPAVAEMAARCRGSVCWYGRDSQHPALRGALNQGGRAVAVGARQILLLEGDREEPLVALSELSLSSDAPGLDLTLAACAAAWSLGLPPSAIRAGLLSFPFLASSR